MTDHPTCFSCTHPAEFLVCWQPPSLLDGQKAEEAKLPHCKPHGMSRLKSLLMIQNSPLYGEDNYFANMAAHLEPLEGVDVTPDAEGESWDA